MFNEYGVYDNWWDPLTKDNFNEKKKCFLNQYSNSNFTIDGLTLRNKLILSQRIISDMGAYKQVFHAYKGYVERHGTEFGLPSLNYTTEQLLLIFAANTICWNNLSDNNINDEETFNLLKYRYKTMIFIHLLSFVILYYTYRVNSGLSNLKEFSDTFECPIDSAMNPTFKCSLW